METGMRHGIANELPQHQSCPGVTTTSQSTDAGRLNYEHLAGWLPTAISVGPLHSAATLRA